MAVLFRASLELIRAEPGNKNGTVKSVHCVANQARGSR